MFIQKKAFFMSFSVVSLLCGSVLADTNPFDPNLNGSAHPSPRVSPSPCPDMNFECKFEGDGSGKDGGWLQKCRAEGSYQTDRDGLAILDNNEDGRLRVICGDDEGDRDDHLIYDDGLRTHFEHDHRTLILKGLGDRAPVITVHSNRNYDRTFPSDLLFGRDGYSYEISGDCRFFRDDRTR
ncbi:MAG: hypothetical protein P4M08_06710 [Oligoflexia bacterium]|nr:hypothetical protein [Oligoflexia bacterium]